MRYTQIAMATPFEGEPKINLPSCYGASPKKPILLKIPVTGLRPITYRAENLPEGLKLEDVQNMVAGFAIQFRGVANAITATALQNSGFPNGVMRKIQNGFFPRTSGDIYINLLPGWIEDADGAVADSGSAFRYDTNVPMIWGGWTITGGTTVTRSVDMCDVAATLAAILRIPIPESASGVAINEIIKQQ